MGLLGDMADIGVFGLAGKIFAEKKRKRKAAASTSSAAVAPMTVPVPSVEDMPDKEGFSGAFTNRARQIDEERKKLVARRA